MQKWQGLNIFLQNVIYINEINPTSLEHMALICLCPVCAPWPVEQYRPSSTKGGRGLSTFMNLGHSDPKLVQSIQDAAPRPAQNISQCPLKKADVERSAGTCWET